MSDDPRCSGCAYGVRNPEPGPEPDIAPMGWWARTFGEDFLGEFNRTMAHRFWERRKVEHEQWTNCHRFPEVREKRVNDFCGEWVADQEPSS